MLEQHTDLIERLVRDSLTRTSEFNEGWTFTNDGTLYFRLFRVECGWRRLGLLR